MNFKINTTKNNKLKKCAKGRQFGFENRLNFMSFASYKMLQILRFGAKLLNH